MKKETETQDFAEDNEANTPDTGENSGSEPVAAEETALQEKAAKADEYWDRLLRQTADFENFKKRAAREKTEAIKFANESLLQKLIPIVDNFEMALSAANSTEANSVESLKQGIGMIHTLLKSTLTDAGLEEIEATGKPFDPNFHEAVSQKETDEIAEGHVVQQLRKGYKLRERLIRPATVIVSKKPSA